MSEDFWCGMVGGVPVEVTASLEGSLELLSMKVGWDVDVLAEEFHRQGGDFVAYAAWVIKERRTQEMATRKVLKHK